MNKCKLIVADMGLEIEVPYRDTKQASIGQLVYPKPVIADGCEILSNIKPIQQYTLTRLPCGNYELDNIEFLSEAIAWFYYKPRAPILSRIIDATRVDVSNSHIKSATTEISYNDTRTMTLEILI